MIKPEHLDNFYRTYRLPRDPFFPLFLMIKRDYLSHRRNLRRAREKYIAERVRSLPPEVRAFLKFLAEYEKYHHPRGFFPLWTRELFPSTKKRVKELSKYDQLQWLSLFRGHLDKLETCYRGVHRVNTDRILAAYLLQLELPTNGRVTSTEPEVRSAYRRLSKTHHPDGGGDGEVFVRLKCARDILLATSRPG